MRGGKHKEYAEIAGILESHMSVKCAYTAEQFMSDSSIDDSDTNSSAKKI